jgi:hypothetical protein
VLEAAEAVVNTVMAVVPLVVVLVEETLLQ